jgi:hypothetical protein
MSNGTWELVDLPEGRAFVNIMGIYNIKFDVGDIYIRQPLGFGDGSSRVGH